MNKHLNDSYTLRLPSELKAKVAESAKLQNRSLNADIVARLEKSFNEDSNQKMFSEKETIHAMQKLMSSIVSNAMSTLLQHGVDKDIVEKIFVATAKSPE